jgi:hypothetical protein
MTKRVGDFHEFPAGMDIGDRHGRRLKSQFVISSYQSHRFFPSKKYKFR